MLNRQQQIDLIGKIEDATRTCVFATDNLLYSDGRWIAKYARQLESIAREIMDILDDEEITDNAS